MNRFWIIGYNRWPELLGTGVWMLVLLQDFWYFPVFLLLWFLINLWWSNGLNLGKTKFVEAILFACLFRLILNWRYGLVLRVMTSSETERYWLGSATEHRLPYSLFVPLLKRYFSGNPSNGWFIGPTTWKGREKFVFKLNLHNFLIIQYACLSKCTELPSQWLFRWLGPAPLPDNTYFLSAWNRMPSRHFCLALAPCTQSLHH